jgi:hypothetical protein
MAGNVAVTGQYSHIIPESKQPHIPAGLGDAGPKIFDLGALPGPVNS